MTWLPSWEGILVATAVMIVVRALWVRHKFDDHRLRRFLGGPISRVSSTGDRYYWSGTSGASRAEIERALSPEYATKHARLMTPSARKAIVLVNIATWGLTMYGGFDLPLGLGLTDSHLSWWGILCIPAWWLARVSARVIADAPEELLDERLLAIRNDSYYEAYRLVGILVSALVVMAIALDIAGTESSVSLDSSSWVSFVITLPFISIWAFSALPSLVIISRQAFEG